jgi:hypothetical protein
MAADDATAATAADTSQTQHVNEQMPQREQHLLPATS